MKKRKSSSDTPLSFTILAPQVVSNGSISATHIVIEDADQLACGSLHCVWLPSHFILWFCSRTLMMNSKQVHLSILNAQKSLSQLILHLTIGKSQVNRDKVLCTVSASGFTTKKTVWIPPWHYSRPRTLMLKRTFVRIGSGSSKTICTLQLFPVPW